jgi:hypothetical protein
METAFMRKQNTERSLLSSIVEPCGDWQMHGTAPSVGGDRQPQRWAASPAPTPPPREPALTILALIALFSVALLLGGMVFFAALIAPLVFRVLPADQGGRFIRTLFPRY